MQIQPLEQPVVTGMQHRSNIKPLRKEEIRFEIDMCIGCDRCMRACPVPISSQVAIADLNRATITGTMASHIAKFTDECVMCGSCVPVCPVNNHRDLLMLALKQRLGTSWKSPVDVRRVTNALPRGWNPALVLSRLREQAMLRDAQSVPDNYLLHVIAASSLLTLAPGDVVIHEGEYGRDINCILEGQFELSTNGPDGVPIPVGILRRGEYMGDYGMLTGHQHNTTAQAQSNALMLAIPEQVMQHLIELAPGVGSHFEQISHARSLEHILKRLALFQGMPENVLQWVGSQTQFREYERDERLFAEDNTGNGGQRGQPARESLHIIMAGFVKVARKTTQGTERIIAYRQGGDYFAGGLDMLGDQRAVTATALSRVRVAEIPRAALLQVFTHFPVVARRFNDRLQQYSEAAALANTGVFAAIGTVGHVTTDTANPFTDATARKGLHSLVSDGVVEGTEVLVIDLDKCIHCSECEEACARRHGHSRMNRKGMVIGNITITTACRQCQDPVCMLCSRAGIARKPGGEVYITESCIGCGICAERCPYDNITIIPLDEARGQPDASQIANATSALWQRFGGYFKDGIVKERRRTVLPMVQPGPLNAQSSGGYDELRKKIAVKCDLCAGYNNQACVQACPTGAAMRIQPATFFGSTEDILRRKAH
ncbi:MAG TPA: cyclic nucleotide-binding domain-containing protein [Ktedonobacteraceae bacterium]|nr:cyclic nucleotide-binding domain-containing protein [Ktedonobacteraceae bacterium]